jgi:hypothetical protein
MLNQKNSLLRNIPNSSYEAGLELAIESSGIANQVIITKPSVLYIKKKVGDYKRLIKLYIQTIFH